MILKFEYLSHIININFCLIQGLAERWKNLSHKAEEAQRTSSLQREMAAMHLELRSIHERLICHEIVLEPAYMIEDNINQITVSTSQFVHLIKECLIKLLLRKKLYRVPNSKKTVDYPSWAWSRGCWKNFSWNSSPYYRAFSFVFDFRYKPILYYLTQKSYLRRSFGFRKLQAKKACKIITSFGISNAMYQFNWLSEQEMNGTENFIIDRQLHSSITATWSWNLTPTFLQLVGMRKSWQQLFAKLNAINWASKISPTTWQKLFV